MIRKLIESSDCDIFVQILKETLNLNLTEIKYEGNIELENNSGYEFGLIKVRGKLKSKEDIEIYLRMVRKDKIKESIFCYWCSIFEEELNKFKNTKEKYVIEKVLISELNKKEYNKSIFLEIENNKTHILDTGTEVNFLDIKEYVNTYQSKKNKYNKILEYLNDSGETVLLIGIKKSK